MSNAENRSTMDEVWSILPEDARKDWEFIAVQEAVSDPKIQTMVGFLPHCTGSLTPEGLIQQIGSILEEKYDAVPAARRAEVIRRAGNELIWQEMGLYGEA